MGTLFQRTVNENYDEIDNEHICFSGSNFRKLLVILYNSMLLKSYIPERMKVGVIIPLYKGGSKRKDDPDSYRAITLTSCVLKLYEHILLKRIMSSRKPFHPLQCGFQKGMGCTYRRDFPPKFYVSILVFVFLSLQFNFVKYVIVACELPNDNSLDQRMLLKN